VEIHPPLPHITSGMCSIYDIGPPPEEQTSGLPSGLECAIRDALDTALA
jgi:hypothetical protein